MPTAAQSEAHTAAAETRALWKHYRRVSRNLLWAAETRHLEPDGDAYSVRRIVRLLREQRRILNELLGGNHENTH